MQPRVRVARRKGPVVGGSRRSAAREQVRMALAAPCRRVGALGRLGEGAPCAPWPPPCPCAPAAAAGLSASSVSSAANLIARSSRPREAKRPSTVVYFPLPACTSKPRAGMASVAVSLSTTSLFRIASVQSPTATTARQEHESDPSNQPESYYKFPQPQSTFMYGPKFVKFC